LRELVVLLLLIFLAVPAQAQLAADLYHAEVSVEDHGARALDRASRAGLAQVMVKLSGSREVLKAPQIRSALNDSKNLLQQYQYLRNDQGELVVLIQYDPELVLQTLADARQPLWPGQRPAVLVWMVVDSGGERTFASGPTSQALREQLEQAFSLRGIPVNFPLYDLQDNLNLDIHDLWQLESLSIYQASQRYDAEHILVARLTRDANLDWMGDWLYLEGGEQQGDSLYGASDSTVAAVGAELAGESMALRYALLPTGDSGEGLYVQIDGIYDYSDYRRVLSHLQNLELVDEARLAFLQGESGVFRLRAQVREQQLKQIIEQQGKLTPQMEMLALDNAPVQPALGYRWSQ
jgi:hypothetical protein